MRKGTSISKNRRKQIICIITVALVLVVLWIWYGNSALTVSEVTAADPTVPPAFDGFRIAQLSDLHNAEFGEGNNRLIAKLENAAPDIIVITGDLVDSRHTDMEVALAFAAEATQIAPVYYVPGNHEARISQYDNLKTGLEKAGVTILENKSVALERDGNEITLMGIADPSFQADWLFYDENTVVNTALSDLMENVEGYTVLLSHRPELFECYVKHGVNLVFTGHAHGGQYRLPFLGGIIAPDQGLFPKYDAGLYKQDDTNMIVSRGLGNSILPFRVNNRPEIVIVELQSCRLTAEEKK